MPLIHQQLNTVMFCLTSVSLSDVSQSFIALIRMFLKSVGNESLYRYPERSCREFPLNQSHFVDLPPS
jgi:hypothetical protein